MSNSKAQGSTYLDHYARGNNLSTAGRKLVWPYFRSLYSGLLPSDRNSRILDFGCGAGVLLEWLRSEGYNSAEGIDTDQSQIRFAESLNVGARWVPNSVEWVKTAGRFDFIFLTDVLEHIPDGADHETLTSLYEALSEGGTLVVKVPNANSSFGTRALYLDPTHRRVYTEELLRCALESAGFGGVRTFSDDFWRPRSLREVPAICFRAFFRTFRRLEIISEFGMAAASWPLSQNVVGVGRRVSG